MEKEVKQEKETKEAFNLEEAYGKTFRRLSEGDIVKGKVLAIGVKDVYIDLGYKSEGIITLGELKDIVDLRLEMSLTCLWSPRKTRTGSSLFQGARQKICRDGIGYPPPIKKGIL